MQICIKQPPFEIPMEYDHVIPRCDNPRLGYFGATEHMVNQDKIEDETF